MGDRSIMYNVPKQGNMLSLGHIYAQTRKHARAHTHTHTRTRLCQDFCLNISHYN